MNEISTDDLAQVHYIDNNQLSIHYNSLDVIIL